MVTGIPLLGDLVAISSMYGYFQGPRARGGVDDFERPATTSARHPWPSTTPDMLPSEPVDLTTAEIRAGAEQKLPSLEVLGNAPVVIGGQIGFALHLRFKTDQGLRMELLIRGFVNKRGLYLLTDRAPTLHYFERDRPVFESLANSFRAS